MYNRKKGSFPPKLSLSNWKDKWWRYKKKNRGERCNKMQECVWLAVKCFPSGTSGKDPTCQRGSRMRRGINPWVGKIPWRSAWQHTLVFLPGESRGHRSLAGYSPWAHKRVGCDWSDLAHFTCDLLWNGYFNRGYRDFPGGPMAKTPCSQCRGQGFNLWSGR